MIKTLADTIAETVACRGRPRHEHEPRGTLRRRGVRGDACRRRAFGEIPTVEGALGLAEQLRVACMGASVAERVSPCRLAWRRCKRRDDGARAA